MKIVEDKITAAELIVLAKESFYDLVKAVVDVKLGIMAVDAELHADQEAILLERGSRQEDLWGINIYPDKPRDEWIEFDSMINLRPSQGNRSRGVEDPALREHIIKVVNKLIG